MTIKGNIIPTLTTAEAAEVITTLAKVTILAKLIRTVYLEYDALPISDDSFCDNIYYTLHYVRVQTSLMYCDFFYMRGIYNEII